MKRFLLANTGKKDAGRLSSRVFYVLVAVIVLVFGMFYLIGFDNSYYDDPQFNAPLLTDLLMALVFTISGAVPLLSLVSVFMWLRTARSQKTINGVPASKIAYGTAGLMLVCMVVAFIFGSEEPVVINGMRYTDTLWLKIAGMFLDTVILLLAVAVILVIFGMSGYNRKINIRKKGNVQT